jgi:hypothetical protein
MLSMLQSDRIELMTDSPEKERTSRTIKVRPNPPIIPPPKPKSTEHIENADNIIAAALDVIDLGRAMQNIREAEDRAWHETAGIRIG